MPSAPSAVDLLLQELESGTVVPERYSRRSAFQRWEPLLRTTGLALIAIVSGMLLGAAPS
jgi:hypothetical protein